MTTKKSSVLSSFFNISYDILFRQYMDNGDIEEREIADNTLLRLTPDSLDVDVIFYGNCIARFTGATCTLHTHGYISPTTKDRLNAVIRGHGTVSPVKGQWTLQLQDKSEWEGFFVGSHDMTPHRFYDGIEFDVNSHEVYSHPPTYPASDYEKLCELWLKLGGNGRNTMLADLGGTVDADRYDTMLRGVIDRYVAIMTEDSVRHGGNCSKCDNDGFRVENSVAGKAIKGSIEEKIEMVRAKSEFNRQFDDEHLWIHLQQNGHNFDLVYAACIICSDLNVDEFDYVLHRRIEEVRKAVRRYLIRRLQKGVTSVR